jgi:hypothetical protein
LPLFPGRAWAAVQRSPHHRVGRCLILKPGANPRPECSIGPDRKFFRRPGTILSRARYALRGPLPAPTGPPPFRPASRGFFFRCPCDRNLPFGRATRCTIGSSAAQAEPEGAVPTLPSHLRPGRTSEKALADVAQAHGDRGPLPGPIPLNCAPRTARRTRGCSRSSWPNRVGAQPWRPTTAAPMVSGEHLNGWLTAPCAA